MSDILVLSVERPYQSEADLLEMEAWTITKKSVFLIGVPPHPEGERVRCELALESGMRLLVAEGVVAKYMEETGNRPSGLVVRYKRMSAASSQFVNRALSVRETTETSSPSAAECPPPSAEVGTFEPSKFDSKTFTPDSADLSIASENVKAAAHRLSAVPAALARLARRRRVSAFVVPSNRESALESLRMRTARPSRT